jgi:hypothetical protein
MSAALQKHESEGANIASFRDVFDALLSDPSLDLKDEPSTTGLPQEQEVKLSLIDECCDERMVRQMVTAGLSFP